MSWCDLGSNTDSTNLQFYRSYCGVCDDVTIPWDTQSAFFITIAVVRESCIVTRIEWRDAV
jgi:hypothetical protein